MDMVGLVLHRAADGGKDIFLLGAVVEEDDIALVGGFTAGVSPPAGVHDKDVAGGVGGHVQIVVMVE